MEYIVISMTIILGAFILASAIQSGLEEAGKRIACGIEHIGEYTISKKEEENE